MSSIVRTWSVVGGGVIGATGLGGGGGVGFGVGTGSSGLISWTGGASPEPLDGCADALLVASKTITTRRMAAC
jgi:hypothetical protein